MELVTKMKFNKIHIYLRQCNNNKPNPNRPDWFDYEKCFKNLLDTIGENGVHPNVKLTVVFDGDESDSYILKYYKNNNFRIVNINTNNIDFKTYQNDGSSKSGALTSYITMQDNLSDSDIVFHLENDYLLLPYWPEIVLDFFNIIPNSELCLLSLYDHMDLYLFRDKTRTDHFSMYKDWKAEIFISNYRHWKTVDLITSSWIMTKRGFNLIEDFLTYGVSDNTTSAEFRKRGGWCCSPIPSLMTHVQYPFLAPIINWELINSNIQLK